MWLKEALMVFGKESRSHKRIFMNSASENLRIGQRGIFDYKMSDEKGLI